MLAGQHHVVGGGEGRAQEQRAGDDEAPEGHVVAEEVELPEGQALGAGVEGRGQVRREAVGGEAAVEVGLDLLGRQGAEGELPPHAPGHEVQGAPLEGGVGGVDVGLAPYHDLESMVPAELAAEVEDVKAAIIAGDIATSPSGEPPAEPEPTTDLGTEDNPLIWAFVPSGEMERVAAGAESVADMIFEETGLVVETFVATEYAGVIEAMCSDPPKAHMGSLATYAYILAVSSNFKVSPLNSPTHS